MLSIVLSFIQNATETGFFLHFQVEPAQFCPIDGTSLCLCFKWKTGRLIISGIVIVVLIYRRHVPIDSINLLGSVR
jgi:hypothetical protein